MSELLQSTEDVIELAGELLTLDQYQLAMRLLQLQGEWQRQGMQHLAKSLEAKA